MRRRFKDFTSKINRIISVKRAALSLGILVVFVTTYLLILPAFTLTQDKAAEKGGIDVPATSIEDADTPAADEDPGAEENGKSDVDEQSDSKDSAAKGSDSSKTAAEETANDSGKSAADADDFDAGSSGGAAGAGADGETSDNDSESKSALDAADPLAFDGEGFSIQVEDTASVLPEDTSVVVEELVEKPEAASVEEAEAKREEYKDYYDKTLAAVNEDANKAAKESDKSKGINTKTISFVKFYNISLQSEGETIQPDQPVNVTISYNDQLKQELKVDEAKDVKIIHFAEDKNTGKVTAEILDDKAVDVTLEESRMAETKFEAESFSVYAVVYTVDFEYVSEVDGQTYEYSIKGGGSIGFKELLPILGVVRDDSETIDDEVADFVGDITEAEFSDPSLVSISKEGDDWILTSLQPFDTEETLTVTLANGDEFVIKVTDAQEAEATTDLESGGTFIIFTKEGNTYHVLKTDGTVDNTITGEDQFDALGSDYKWTFNFVFEEKHRESTHSFRYYFIRPANDLTRTIALNDAGNEIVEPGTNNIAIEAIEDAEGGFSFRGYNISEDSHIFLEFKDGAFRSVYEDNAEITPARIFIYEQEVMPRYNFTVKTADSSMGTVSGRNASNQPQNNVNSYGTVTTSTTAADDKKNQYQITANPVSHQNPELQNWQQGYGQNKWIFDYWELNGSKLDSNVYGQTLNAGSLPITENNSVLTAHFKQNPSYVVPNSEKDGTNINKLELERWLQKLKGDPKPLDDSATKKTAEVYDYENRIYRVDFTTKPSLSTFEGIIDMGFILDVSASMKFPSKLNEISGMSNVDIRNINSGYVNWQNRRFYYSGLTFNIDKNYYIISDAQGTSTVYLVKFRNNRWEYKDASAEDSKFAALSTSATFKAKSYDNYDHNYHYQIYEDGDNGRDRQYYLNNSLNGTLDELDTILDVLALGANSNDDPEVNVAWNTFCNWLPNGDGEHQYTFKPASEGITISIDDGTFAGGTSTDIALLDAAGKRRGDVSSDDEVHTHDSNTYNGWGKTTANYDDWNQTDRTFYNYTDPNKGFQWDAGATKYAVLITDGAPQRAGASIDSRYVEDAANQLKNNGEVKLITIGLGIDNVTSGKILLYDIADNDDEGHKLFYSAKSGDELQYALYDILKRIIKDATVQGDVTDTINEAFYPVDKATGKALDNNDKIALDGTLITGTPSGPYGTIIKTGNASTGYTYQVKWENQDFPLDGWHGAVFVKAYEDLLGGNAILTNEGMAKFDAKSYKIQASEDPVYFKDESNVPEADKKLKTKLLERESPRVNVNELSFLRNNSEWSVYLGTEVDPKDELKRLINNIKIEEVVNSGKDTIEDKFHIPDMIDYSDASSHHYALAPDNITDSRSAQGAAESFKMVDLLYELIQKCVTSGDTSRNDWANFLSGDELNLDYLISTLQSGSIVIPYDEYGINDSLHKIRNADGTEGLHRDNSTITITLSSVVKPGEEDLDPSPHNTTVVGSEVEKYTFTVVYSPDYDVLPKGQGGKSIEDFHVGTFGTMYQGHAAGTETSENIHIINVIVKGLEITKKDFSGEILLGAKFALYRSARGTDDASAVETVGGLDGNFVKVADLDTSTTGVAQLDQVDQLLDGEKYYIVETVTPDGYETKAPIEVIMNTTNSYTPKPDGSAQTTVPETEPYDWTETVTLALDQTNVSGVIQTDAEGNDVSHSGDYTVDPDDNIMHYTIINNSGVELPESGGPGTTLFYIFGSALVLGCGIMLVARRRSRKAA